MSHDLSEVVAAPDLSQMLSWTAPQQPEGCAGAECGKSARRPVAVPRRSKGCFHLCHHTHQWLCDFVAARVRPGILSSGRRDSVPRARSVHRIRTFHRHNPFARRIRRRIPCLLSRSSCSCACPMSRPQVSATCKGGIPLEVPILQGEWSARHPSPIQVHDAPVSHQSRLGRVALSPASPSHGLLARQPAPDPCGMSFRPVSRPPSREQALCSRHSE
jgi:hypothetical protein